MIGYALQNIGSNLHESLEQLIAVIFNLLLLSVFKVVTEGAIVDYGEIQELKESVCFTCLLVLWEFIRAMNA